MRRTRVRRRGWARTTAVAVMAGALVAAGLSSAQAVVSPGTFEGDDGDRVAGTAGTTDWDDYTVAPHADVASGASDTSLSGDEDDPSPGFTQGSIQSNKSDLVEFLLHTEKVGGADFLYLGWERVPDPSGNVNVDFELNRLPQPAFPAPGQDWDLARSPGDRLFMFQLVQGGTVPELDMLRWMTSADPADPLAACEHPGGTFPCWGAKVHLTPASAPAAEAGVDVVGGDVVFGEAAINLAAAGIFQAGVCTNFGSAYAKSRSSGSGFRSQLSDVIAPVGVTVSSCSDLTVVKNTTGGDGTFTFDVDCANGTAFDRSDEPITTAGGTGSFTVTGIPHGTTCTVAEDAAAGWTPVGPTTRITAVDRDVTLTFANARDHGKVVVEKRSTGGDGTFAFDVECPGVAGYPVRLAVTTLAGTGSAETAADIPQGTACTVTEQPQPGTWTAVGAASKPVAVSGPAATVFFSNRRDTGRVTVEKTTVGGDGTFAFTVECPGVAGYPVTVSVTTAGGSGAASTAADIPTGSRCTVTEVAQLGAWVVTGPRARQVAVDGPEATVSYTNTRAVGTLAVVVNAIGGDGAFAYTVDCDGTAFDREGLISTVGGTGSAPPVVAVPTGTACTVSQATAPGWTLTAPSPQARVVAGDEVVVFVDERHANGIDVVKTPSTRGANPGQPVTYTYGVRATGPDALTEVTVTDDLCAPVVSTGGDADGDGRLDPGETWTYSCVSAADGSRPTNVATATAREPGGATVSDRDSVTIAVVEALVLRAPAPALPRTGLDAGTLGRLGIALVLLGGYLLLAVRVRRSSLPR